MKRRALAGAILVVIVAVPAFLLTNGGGGGAARAALVVDSVPAGPASPVALRFRAPATSGHRGGLLVAYTLSVSGPVRRGCVGVHSQALAVARRGAVVSATLDPATFGGSWCAGTFAVRVVETERPFCPPGTMCPQFIRLIGTVARASFRVAR